MTATNSKALTADYGDSGPLTQKYIVTASDFYPQAKYDSTHAHRTIFQISTNTNSESIVKEIRTNKLTQI